MGTIDHKEEEELLTAVKEAAAHVEAGLSPDAAIEKVARDHGFGPGKIRLIGQGYNTGQQLGQWKSASGGSILDKMASFPLCDPEKVVASVYAPAEKTASVSTDWSRPPAFPTPGGREKTASYKLPESPKPAPYTPEPIEALRKAGAEIGRTKLAADEARRQAAASKDAVTGRLREVTAYFKQASHDRRPFAEVEAVAVAYFGKTASALLDLVYREARLEARKEKRATDAAPVLKQGVDLSAGPYALIKSAIDAAANCHALTKKAADLHTQAAAVREDRLRPFSGAGEVSPQTPTGPWTKEAAAVFGTEKRAFGFGTEVSAIALGDILAHNATHQQEITDPYGDVSYIQNDLDAIREQSRRAIGHRRRPRAKQVKEAFFGGAAAAGAMGAALGRTVGQMPKPKDDMVEDQWMALEDPDHQNELRKIRAHAMINQLLTDPDDPISGHEPDRVLEAYNEISATTPRLAENIATLRPALRKHLEGHQQPFETKELLDIEHGLAKSKLPTPNTSILGDAPEKLLG